MMKKLTDSEEVEYLKQLYGGDNVMGIYESLRESFNVLQLRSQLLLSLIVVCLTITGFSGPRIAESGPLARIALFGGVLGVLVAAVILVAGPLRIRWITQWASSDSNETIRLLICRRNNRTKLYHAAAGTLLVGLTGYVLSLAAFLVA